MDLSEDKQDKKDRQRPLPNFKDPQSIFDLLNFVVFEFVSLSGSVVTRICEGDMGITREEWQFVAMLAKLGGMSPSDLASRTTVDRSQASKTLRTLEVKGLVNRHQVQGDGRRAIIGLTQQGLALYAEFFPKVVHLHNEILQDLNDDQRDDLAQLMNVLHVRAKEATASFKPENRAPRRQGGRKAKWQSTKLLE
jgi:DNA-binding MarR family transcriptional regulator